MTAEKNSLTEISYGLCGKSLSHSYSELIHKSLGNSEYQLLNMSKDEFADFMKSRAFRGINITIPYKKDALSLCDFVSENAREIGSVNTVINRGGILCGYNTDLIGFEYMLKHAKISLDGKNVIILGSGGTCLTAKAAAHKHRAKKVTIVSRSGNTNYENVYSLRDTQIIINTTPVGMFPSNGEVPIDISRFENLCGVADVIYNPFMTRLTYLASTYGIPYANGLSMLAAQAVKAHELFFDTEFRNFSETVENVTEKCKAYTENISLIGMPGSGKTTVGRLLAKLLEKDFFDSDEFIENCEHRTPENIIVSDGEPHFRALENAAVYELSKKSSSVIAYGGGAVLDKENRYMIKQNGRCVYIKRDTDKLEVSGRPLSDSGKALEKLYSERNAIYKELADVEVDIDENPGECAMKIVDLLGLHERNRTRK